LRLKTAGGVLSVIVLVVIQAPDHPESEHIGFVFRIGPKNVMTHLMINRINPSSF
jgi:hypothetical protein